MKKQFNYLALIASLISAVLLVSLNSFKDEEKFVPTTVGVYVNDYNDILKTSSATEVVVEKDALRIVYPFVTVILPIIEQHREPTVISGSDSTTTCTMTVRNPIYNTLNKAIYFKKYRNGVVVEQELNVQLSHPKVNNPVLTFSTKE